MGMGWQIAPNLGFGFSFGLLMGDESRTNEFTSYYKQRAFEDISVFMDRTYFGYDARIGLMYKPHPMVSLGCRVEIPRYAKVAEHYQEVNYLALQESYDQSNFGNLKSSLAGSLGLALLLPYATISIDASGREPISGAREKSDGSYWKGGCGIGFEAPLPWIASLVRCGYSYSQLDLIPVIIVWDDPGADTKETVTGFHGRHLLTAGYSLLTSGGVSLEAAYGYQFWNFTTSSPDWEAESKEIHAQHRIMISASIRY
jgi:hypothetical protein